MRVVNARFGPPFPEKPGFAEHVAPIFERYCFECHGIEATESNLDLRTLESALVGGDSGPVIVPGKPGESFLLDQLIDEMMPPEGAMPKARDIALVRQWIAAGALP